MKPFQHKSDVPVAELVDAVKDERSTEVFIQNISLRNADVGDVNARHVTHCCGEEEKKEARK